MCSETLGHSLTHIFNKSFHTAQVPQLFKMANVTPLFKSGDRSVASNYRPISLLPTVARIFERFVYRQLSSYLENRSLLPVTQFA